MCGIAGVIDREQNGLRAVITRMTSLVDYRGPDGHGVILFEEDGVALGHRRLSIIDPNPSGSQPMRSFDSRYWIVFNGEIYNYREIRVELESLGFTFCSNTDTEVLLNAYIVWGEACLERLIGMFAFGIWDNGAKTLFAARDRLGIKPFYYVYNGQSLYFASELKSLIFADCVPNEVDRSLIDSYMDFGFVPGEGTLFKNVKRLLPGHFLKMTGGKLCVRQYWDYSFNSPVKKNLADYSRDVEDLLKESIDLRLRSDVPLGVFLSGGLDSSTVVSLLAPGAASGLKTFSVSYDFGPGFDETPYAREVAKAYGTDHHEIVVTPKEFLETIPKFIWHMDEPVAEAAAISLYHVSRLARDHVVVCLSGEGADEIFAGYDFYAYNLMMERVRSFVGGGGLRVVSSLGQKLGFSRKIKKYLSLMATDLEERYKGISSYETSMKRSLYSTEFFHESAQGNSELKSFVSRLFSKSKDWDPLSRMLYFDTKTWLVDDLLIKADRMSMAASIELRVPFLDHRLVELAATVPSSYKLHGKVPKYILKKIVQKRLPQSIITRKKMGFPTPLEMMLKEKELYEFANDVLLSDIAVSRRYFDRRAVIDLLKNHKNGMEKNHREIWQLLTLELWHKEFTDSRIGSR